MKKNIKLLLACICFMFCILSLMINGKTNSETKYTNKEYNNNASENGEAIESSSENSNIIGSIKISGTNIDEILVQSDDNEYYMNRDEYGNYSNVGSTFMDYRNKIGDRKLLIYGHNSRTLKDAPFHDLEQYLDESFYKDNKYIELTLNNKKEVYEIFSVMVVKADKYPHMIIEFSDSDWLKHLTWMKNESLYETSANINGDDKIITLQTCYYEPNNSFLLINAKKI